MHPSRHSSVIQVEILSEIFPGSILVHGQTRHVVILVETILRIFKCERVVDAIGGRNIAAAELETISIPRKARNVQEVRAVSETPAVRNDYRKWRGKQIEPVITVFPGAAPADHIVRSKAGQLGVDAIRIFTIGRAVAIVVSVTIEDEVGTGGMAELEGPYRCCYGIRTTQ